MLFSFLENYVQEILLVLSCCSFVSLLGSFESLFIVSFIFSDFCSGQGSGIISFSELFDSFGQIMFFSWSKMLLLVFVLQGFFEVSQFSLQWESYVKCFLDIVDC